MTAIQLLKTTTEYEVLQSFRDKVAILEQERSYSEEDMKLSFEAGLRKANSVKKHSECWKEWFEQVKKK